MKRTQRHLDQLLNDALLNQCQRARMPPRSGVLLELQVRNDNAIVIGNVDGLARFQLRIE